jgi:glycosyltransferase involved in cell wall biosynthesis
LEVVVDGHNGIVCEPSPAAVASACASLAKDPERARRWGRAGKQAAEGLTWDAVADRLLSS